MRLFPELLIEIGVSIVQSGPADESMMVATPRSHKIAWQGHKIVKDGGGSPGKSSSRPDVPITCPRSFTPVAQLMGSASCAPRS